MFSILQKKQKSNLRDIAPFWENNNLRARGEALLPEEVECLSWKQVSLEWKVN